MKPIFNNIQNKKLDTVDGVKFFSRSSAVVAHIWIKQGTSTFVLIGQRGNSGDQPFKFNMPCGYMDWNETLEEALFREVWEECGLDLKNLIFDNKVLFKAIDQPWSVNTDPKENRENISFHCGLLIDIEDKTLPELSLDNMEPDEVLGINFWDLNVAKRMKTYDWAFNHNERLIDFENYLESKFIL
jgi:8-oxo-dGTP pyrophosphatase MutT (NUDIX family)